MSFLIDTDTASAHLRGISSVTSRFLQYNGRLFISTVCLAELKSWVYRKKTPVKYRRGLTDMLHDFHVLDVDEAVAEKSGEVGADRMDHGISIATPDLLIGATALVHDLTVVTHNTQHFTAIPSLRVADWLPP
ncbi:MAG: type II toxin-antitoxin system VapC family toxin [Pirellulales bacterium]